MLRWPQQRANKVHMKHADMLDGAVGMQMIIFPIKCLVAGVHFSLVILMDIFMVNLALDGRSVAVHASFLYYGHFSYLHAWKRTT